MLDGSLVPFCSKYLDACMRANDVPKRFEKEFKTCADCLRADSPAQRGGQSAILFEKYTKEVLVSGGLDFYRADGPAQAGGLSAPLTKIVPETCFVSGGKERSTADGPPLGRGRSTGHLEICTRDVASLVGLQG